MERRRRSHGRGQRGGAGSVPGAGGGIRGGVGSADPAGGDECAIGSG